MISYFISIATLRLNKKINLFRIDLFNIRLFLFLLIFSFDITLMEEKDGVIFLVLDNGTETISLEVNKVLRNKITDRYDYISNNNRIAFDQDVVIASGIEKIKEKVNSSDIVFNMMPDYFTLGELQQVYEVLLGKKLLDAPFRRIIASKVEKTEKMKTGEGHRPSYLFRYNNKK